MPKPAIHITLMISGTERGVHIERDFLLTLLEEASKPDDALVRLLTDETPLGVMVMDGVTRREDIIGTLADLVQALRYTNDRRAQTVLAEAGGAVIIGVMDDGTADFALLPFSTAETYWQYLPGIRADLPRIIGEIRRTARQHGQGMGKATIGIPD